MIKELTKDNIEEYINLCHIVVENLENRAFLIPCTDDQLRNIFDDDSFEIYGYFIDDKLVSSAQIIKNDDKYELGGFLTLPDYRGKGYMKQLCNYILSLNPNHEIIITVHPDNIASTKVIESLGATLIDNKNVSGYNRNVYIIK